MVAELNNQGYEAAGFVCHVGRAEDRENLIKFAVDTYGGLDVLVNNAAVSTFVGNTLDTPELALDKMLDINIKSALLLTALALPHLEASTRHPSILFVSSEAAYQGSFLIGFYGITKTALLGMTKVLGTELGPKGIRVNAIAPGVIDTKFAEMIVESGHGKDNPLGRVGQPDDCGKTAAFLLSDDASFVNGEVIKVTGGKHCSL